MHIHMGWQNAQGRNAVGPSLREAQKTFLNMHMDIEYGYGY